MGFIVGTDNPETLDGTTNDDEMFGLNEDDTLNALAGNDFLDGGQGNDTLNGGAGNDIYMVDALGDLVKEDEHDGNDIVYASASYILSGSAWVELLSAIDNSATNAIDLTGNDHTTAIFGNNGVNVLTGGTGDETLLGFADNDVLNGGDGNDHLFGMNDNDTLNGGAGNDYLDGGVGININIMTGGTGDDTFLVQSNLDIVNELSGEGSDTVFTTTSFVLAAAASVELLSTIDNSATDTINLTSGDTGALILGNNGLNTLTGRIGNDTILGFGGIDTLNGADGNDKLFGMDGFDRLNGGNGQDYLDGGSGVDAMFGGSGSDVYIVDDSGDMVRDSVTAGTDLVYTSVDYRLDANEAVDWLFAIDRTATTALRLFGNGAANLVYGNDGDNFIDGSGGADTLTGYAGADIFNFSEVGSINPRDINMSPVDIDVVVDFTPGEDKIRLDTVKFQGVLGVTGFFETGSAATSAATRVIYDPATGRLSYDQDGSGNLSAKTFAQLSTGLTLHESDFIIEANKAPEAHADTYALIFADNIHGVTIDIAMKQNDFDVDGYGLWVTKMGADGHSMVAVSTGLSPTTVHGTYGILSGGAKSNTFTYSLDLSDPDTTAIAPGQTVTEVFNYEVSDGVLPPFLQLEPMALFATSTITISITRAADGSFSSSIDAKAPDHAPAVAAPEAVLPGEPALGAASQDAGPVAIQQHLAFDHGSGGPGLRLMMAAMLDQPELLGHHPQLA